MSDDPREILKAAGVECAEVTRYIVLPETHTRCADAAILALARLTAKYKWQRDQAIDEVPEDWGWQREPSYRDYLDRRWEERDA